MSRRKSGTEPRNEGQTPDAQTRQIAHPAGPPNMRTAPSARYTHARQIVSCAVVLLFIFLVSCSKAKSSADQEQTRALTPQSSDEPSREDLIEAVRRSVEAKSYSESVPQSQRWSHACSQYDVDVDPYAKENPQLARCPYVGATYWTTETIYVNQFVHCQTLPGPQFGWTVNPRTSDSWLVSHSGSAWDVSKVEGTSANQGESVHVSKFSFLVVPHQKC
jgi:hypothetical protein